MRGIETVTTDANGNLATTEIWQDLPDWWTLPWGYTYYDIVVDVNRNGKYDKGIDVVDSLSNYGFCIDPIWASDVNGNVKETFTVNEIVYVNGTGLIINNTNITLYIFIDYNNWNSNVSGRVGRNFSDYNPIVNKTNVSIDGNGNFVSVVAMGNLTNGSYDVIADLNKDGIIQEEEVYGMDDNTNTGFSVVNISEKATNIFDAVEMLEYLSGQKPELSHSDNSYYKFVGMGNITLFDVFALIAQIVTEG